MRLLCTVTVLGATLVGARPATAQTPARTQPTTTTATTTEDTTLDGEAVVRVRRPPREVTRRTLEPREIERVPGTGGDALRAVQNLPGIARPPFLTGLVIVRGAAPQDTGIFLDGSDIPLAYHFGGLSSVVPSDILERIDFYPGNFSARYGRVQAGVIDVGIRAPRTDGLHGAIAASVIDAGFRLEGPITRTLSFLVAGRRSYLDAVLGGLLSGAGLNAIALPVYYDYQAALEWRPTPRDRLRIMGFGADDRFAFLFTRPQDVDPTLNGQVGTHTLFHRFQILYSHDFSTRTNLRALFATGYDDNAIHFARVADLDIDRVPLNGRVEVSHGLSRTARVNVGLDLFAGPVGVTFRGPRPPGDGAGVVTSTEDLEQVATQSTPFIVRPALWADLELQPTRALRVIPALRMDYFADLGRVTLSPRVAVRFEVARGSTLKGGVGMFTQAPQFQESLDAPNRASAQGFLVGNPNLAPQRAMHLSLGFEREFSPALSLSIEGFARLADQLVVARGVQASAVPYTNSGFGRAYGVEVLLRHRPVGRLMAWVAYTLSRSERRDHPGERFDVTDFDQTHIFTAVLGYRLGRGWEVGGRFRYVSGIPDAPPTGVFYNADTQSYVPVYPATSTDRVPAFHQLDVRIDKTFTFARWRLGVFLDVQNAYVHANAEFFSYSFDYAQRTVTRGLPILPSLGVRGEF